MACRFYDEPKSVQAAKVNTNAIEPGATEPETIESEVSKTPESAVVAEPNAADSNAESDDVGESGAASGAVDLDAMNANAMRKQRAAEPMPAVGPNPDCCRYQYSHPFRTKAQTKVPMKAHLLPCHLTYCTNIHPGETWPEVFANLLNLCDRAKAASVPPIGPLALGYGWPMQRLKNCCRANILLSLKTGWPFKTSMFSR